MDPALQSALSLLNDSSSSSRPDETVFAALAVIVKKVPALAFHEHREAVLGAMGGDVFLLRALASDGDVRRMGLNVLSTFCADAKLASKLGLSICLLGCCLVDCFVA